MLPHGALQLAQSNLQRFIGQQQLPALPARLAAAAGLTGTNDSAGSHGG
jgi:hypothetical protein